MEMLKKCFNPKVLIALAIAALAVAIFAPDTLSRVLPLLIIAVCPLSMVVMVVMMNWKDKK